MWNKRSAFQQSVFSVLTQSACFDLWPWSSLLTLTTFHSDWHHWHAADPQSPRYSCQSQNVLPQLDVFTEIVSYRMFWQAGKSVNVCTVPVIGTTVTGAVGQLSIARLNLGMLVLIAFQSVLSTSRQGSQLDFYWAKWRKGLCYCSANIITVQQTKAVLKK